MGRSRMPEGARSLERPIRGLEDNIKMDLGKMELVSTNWIYLAQDELSYSIKFSEIVEQLSDWTELCGITKSVTSHMHIKQP
jgi:hypothetical protein